VVLVGSLTSARAVLQAGVPTAGMTLAQLRTIGSTLGGLLGLVASGALLGWATRQLGVSPSLRLSALAVAVLLTGLTVRTMVTFNFVNYDLATEFLVYAHGTPDIKLALDRIRDVSWETTGSPHNVQVAYGEDGSWPFTWYMVAFPNNYFYSTQPDAQKLLESPAVIAGSPQYGTVEEILGDAYVAFDYTYLWWPIQDYFNLTWDAVIDAVTDPELRAAVWDIIWRREYRRYARHQNAETPFTLESWPYRKNFRLYIRREIAEQIWPYERPSGVARFARPEATKVPDPYAAGIRTLREQRRITLPGAVVRGFERAADGALYVADTANHRVWRISPDDQIEAFGEFGTGPGQFNEPWDVAIDEAGDIYVADTWNHRIQKFDSSHRFLTSWGTLVQVADTGDPGAQGLFYGPRALTFSEAGELYVADTGNKRVQVFSPDGAFLREFGGGGVGAGRLDEPVGIDVNAEGVIAVADTWNSRVQLFTEQGVAIRQWGVPTWDVDNPDEKPFVAWGENGLYVTEPMRRRVLAFDATGAFRWAVGADGGTNLAFAQSVLVVDDTLLVGDAHRGEITVYELP
jgi:sugar lactone lactonase YvrE